MPNKNSSYDINLKMFNEKSAEKPVKFWKPSSACFRTPKHNSKTSIAEGQTNVMIVKYIVQ